MQTNTIVTSSATGSHTLHIWVTATDVPHTGANQFKFLQSAFGEVGLIGGWSVTESTFFSLTDALFGGTPLATATFTSTGSQTFGSPAFLQTSPFGGLSLTARYDITTNGPGFGNSGISINVAPDRSSVPECPV